MGGIRYGALYLVGCSTDLFFCADYILVMALLRRVPCKVVSSWAVEWLVYSVDCFGCWCRRFFGDVYAGILAGISS
jgi:hypothetical protein